MKDEEPRTASWAPGRNTPSAVRPRLVPLPEPGTVLAERFVIEAVLGKGGTGVVYVASDRRLGQRVAIKLLHPDLVNDISRERLRREVQAARHGHANVVTVYDLHDDGGPMPFLSMELVEGRSLARVLGEERRRLAIEETISLGRQIAAALDHLHAHGLVHRDVKPSNILLTADGTAKLCDLGLVRLLERGETLTATAMTVGTPAYMAPEQGSGGELTPAADVYALGLTLYECLTGKVPHAGDTALDTLVRRQKARPPALRRDDPACPRWLERLLARMLEPRPGDRPAAMAVARALETRRVRRRVSRRAAVAAAAVALVAAVGMLGGRALATRETVRVEVVGDEVRGLDANGQLRWLRRLPGPAVGVHRVDLDGVRPTDVLVVAERTVGAGPRPEAAPGTTQAFFAVAGDGRMVARFDPAEELAGRWRHPFSRCFSISPQSVDLDLDGAPELVLSCRHADFYPNLILVHWARDGIWDLVLDHPGFITSIVFRPDAFRPGMLLAGLNNDLGVLPFFAALELMPPKRRQAITTTYEVGLCSPHDGPGASACAAWSNYLLFPERSGDALTRDALVEREGGGCDVSVSGSAQRLDRFGNPMPGPNVGNDLRRARLEFLARFRHMREHAAVLDAGAVTSVAARIREEFAAVVSEPASRAALELAAARALAGAGDLIAALYTLRAAEATGYSDVGYRLAHLQALSGDLVAAKATLHQVIIRPRSTRSLFDGPHLLARVAIEDRDQVTLKRALSVLRQGEIAQYRHVEVAPVLHARARLWWDALLPSDLSVRSDVFVPEGDAIACLGRWRAGRAEAGDREAMHSAVLVNPDAASEGRLALAAVLLGTDAAADALAVLDRLISSLANDAREDFAVHQIRELAQALRAKALLAAGRPADARTAAAELHPSLTPGLLPAVLCREVLDQTRGSS